MKDKAITHEIYTPLLQEMGKHRTLHRGAIGESQAELTCQKQKSTQLFKKRFKRRLPSFLKTRKCAGVSAGDILIRTV